MKKAILILGVLSTLVSSTWAFPIIRNYGTEYPTTDGDFIRVKSGTITETASSNDRGGLPTRIITDVGTGRCLYQGYLDSSTIADAMTNGFVIRAIMYDHVDDDPVDWGIMLDYNDPVNDKRIALQFGSDPDGRTIVRVALGTNIGSYTNATRSIDKYELRYDTVADNMDLFVNGVEVISDIGFVNAYADAGGSSLRWGSNSTPDSGESHWNLVEFSVFQSISSSTQSASGVEVRWPSAAGAKYHVQYSTDLIYSGWIDLATIAGTGSEISAFDPNATTDKRFYSIFEQ